MALETTNYQCPSCNGSLRYSGASGLLECDFCGSKFTIEEVERLFAEKQAKADDKAAKEEAREEKRRAVEAAEAAATGAAAEQPAAQATAAQAPQDADPIQNYLNRSKWSAEEAENLRSYTCSSCGAQLLTDQTTAVTSCPYCGNPTVLPGQMTDAMKPEYVIPFKYDKKAAVDALKAYYKGKKFLPNTFANANHLEEIQGVYVPFWLFTADTQGNGTFKATRSQAWADSKNTYVKTDYYQARRLGKMHFDKVPVDASSKMPDAHMDAIEPFDYGEMKPFSFGYLPGYLTDRYDQDADDCRSRAESRMRQSTEDMLQSSVTGYETVSTESCNVQTSWNDAAYALLPVWMLHTKWSGQDFLFAMNGQTGKLIGDLPVDNGKVVKQFLLVFAPLLAVVLIVVFGLLG